MSVRAASRRMDLGLRISGGTIDVEVELLCHLTRAGHSQGKMNGSEEEDRCRSASRRVFRRAARVSISASRGETEFGLGQ